MRKTFVNGTLVSESPVEPLSKGYFTARNWKNTVVSGPFGSILYNSLYAQDFEIEIRQFLIKSRNPVPIEIVDDEKPGGAFVMCIFDPLVTEWEGFPRRVMKEGQYGLLHMRPERFTTSLKRGVYALYKVNLPDHYFDYLLGRHCKLAEFYVKIRDNRPALLCVDEKIKAPWHMYFNFKKLLETPLDGDDRELILYHFLERFIDLLIPPLVKGIVRPISIPYKLHRIAKVARMIEEDPSRDLSANVLSVLAKTSKTNLNIGFQELFGVTPNGFVTEVRLQKALDLVLNSNETMKGISQKTGYSNDMVFLRAFKHVLNIYPSELRAKEGVVNGS
ncbi:MAG: AraC family transcriptional regulator [Puia sp.]|nr:AraC family transcriptional regulator [Puia sp.]